MKQAIKRFRAQTWKEVALKLILNDEHNICLLHDFDFHKPSQVLNWHQRSST